MSYQTNQTLPPAPQLGRELLEPIPQNTVGFWKTMRERILDLGGSFDQFASDAQADVRELGRIARQRRPQQANDYFVLGDRCAQLSLHDDQIRSPYANKTIDAYVHAAEIEPLEAHNARRGLLHFALWLNDLACQLDSYQHYELVLSLCQRINDLPLMQTYDYERTQLTPVIEQLQQALASIVEAESDDNLGRQAELHIQSRALCDQGQMLLREERIPEALRLLDQAVQLQPSNALAWQWRAMALSDSGQFQQALASFDTALEYEPRNASIHNQKGSLLLHLGRLEPALLCFEQALQFSTEEHLSYAIFLFNKGQTLFMLKEYELAHDVLMQSYQLESNAKTWAGVLACREQMA